ncbi:uncharacterized protein LOC110710034 [Chenopodium quinoa]|uniref:uncharacterized protein LOC110710034 n=1 Tax=Chenopodium quinoa TaxID=63459 RepID=UPI000B7893AF|nr:uncharacterized protein LOC110710034 [Chenopodium quinoa]
MHEKLQDTIMEAWNYLVFGSAMMKVWNKLKNVTGKNQETNANDQIKYWTGIQESIYRQKSRVDWVKLDLEQVAGEISKFYKKLLGQRATWLPAIDMATMRRGEHLSVYSQQFLLSPITHDEIDATLKNIDDSKAPGIDGGNAPLSPWSLKFTSCTVIYKLVSKIIIAGLAKVIGEVMDGAQARFNPSKHIGDNILLATEFIKGYSHKFITPRCMCNTPIIICRIMN